MKFRDSTRIFAPLDIHDGLLALRSAQVVMPTTRQVCSLSCAGEDFGSRVTRYSPGMAELGGLDGAGAGGRPGPGGYKSRRVS